MRMQKFMKECSSQMSSGKFHIADRRDRATKATTDDKCAKQIIVRFVLLTLISFATTIEMVQGSGVDYCYSDIGCFPLSDEFYHPTNRPFNVRPWHRRLINTEFEIFNVDHPDGFTIRPWNRLSLLHSKFNPMLETKVIIPGWLDSVDNVVWIKQIRDAFLWLWQPQVNLIIIRWRNFTPYTIATANTRVVGAEMANMIKFIEHELAYDRSYYHLIGHSLGAHISGYCGDRIPGLGRITALDPARPFFQGMPKSVRLDRSDAKFVDAIHSDFTPENAILLLMSYGMTTPVGHVDFYPNGPPLLQPGCLRDTIDSIRRGIIRGLQYNSLTVTFLESLRYLTACDHQRSHEWFVESVINRECVFVGVRCNTYEGLINGRCTCDDSASACAIMGIHADQMYINHVHEDVWPIKSNGVKRLKAPQQHVPGKEQIYHQMRLEASHMRLPAEPSVELFDEAELFIEGQESIQMPVILPATSANNIIINNNKNHNNDAIINSNQTNTSNNKEAYAKLEYEYLISQAKLFEDAMFANYLREMFLTQKVLDEQQLLQQQQQQLQLDEQQLQQPPISKRQDSWWQPEHLDVPPPPPPRLLEGNHASLMSDHDRNIENWYEDSSRWYLKTNNQPKYCANQYQIMVYLGPVRARRSGFGDDRLRANLIVSIIGSRGQLLNQRFVPRSFKLDSFTMQPFFILLEGSYSLGQIRSVAVAWEQRNEPEPVQATISFQNNKLAELETHIPVLKMKHPWLSKTVEYDRSHLFQRAPKNHAKYAHKRSSSSSKSPASSRINIGGTSDQVEYKMIGRRSSSSSTHASKGKQKLTKRMGLEQLDGSTSDDIEDGEVDDIDYADAANIDASIDKLLGQQSLISPTFESMLMAHERPVAVDQQHRLSPVVELAQQNHHMKQQQQPEILAPIPDVGEREQSFLEPLVEGLVSPNQLVDKQQAMLDDGQVSMELNNIDLLLDHENNPSSEREQDDSIVVHKVVVSPVQAHYGKLGRPNAKSFCSPRIGLRLRRDQTVKLKPSIMGLCH